MYIHMTEKDRDKIEKSQGRNNPAHISTPNCIQITRNSA